MRPAWSEWLFKLVTLVNMNIQASPVQISALEHRHYGISLRRRFIGLLKKNPDKFSKVHILDMAEKTQRQG